MDSNSIYQYVEKFNLKVFPVKAKDKTPNIKNWQKNATNEIKIIKQWAKQFPNCNWGMTTGEIIVIDIDPRHGGRLDSLPFPNTLRVKTGGGGYHLYFKNPGYEIKNSASKIAEGVDVRGFGGYVVMPPSNHPLGGKYRFDDENAILETLPEWLYRLMIGEDQKKTIKNHEKNNTRVILNEPNGKNDTIPDGERNDTLFKLGSSLRAKGLSPRLVYSCFCRI